MRIQLSDHFHYSRLIRFVLPTIVMMVFTSIYTVVDGLFVSNFARKTAFAAVNLIMPILMGMGAVGFLIGTGGSAVISRTLGEGNREKACQYFSMMIYVTIGIGIMLSVVGLIFLRPISQALGAEGQMLEDCVTYGTIWLIFQTAFILQCAFQSFFVTAEKPKLGLYVTVAADWCSLRNRHQPDGWRCFPTGIFCSKERQSAPIDSCQNRVENSPACLHKRLFRADDQFVRFAGQYSL